MTINPKQIIQDIMGMLPDDTRNIINVVSKNHSTTKQRISGYLSKLKRDGIIRIEVEIPKKKSKAYKI